MRPRRFAPSIRPLAVAGVALFALALGKNARAEGKDLEREVKAAYIYKFASYVEWPAAAFPTSDAPLIIGVLGDDEMEDDLEKLVSGRTSAGRAVQVMRVKTGTPLPPVHILFVASPEEARLKADIHAAAGQPVLVVTETPGALALGSMINFTLEQEHVRFEVALAPAEAAGLGLSSRMLSVARSVTGGRP